MPTTSNAITRTGQALERAATGAQKAVVGLLLTEHEYEMYDFERFFMTLGELAERFDAIRGNADERSRDAVAVWDASLAQLSEALGLVPRPSSPCEALMRLGDGADRYLVDVRHGGLLPVDAHEGEYWLVPKLGDAPQGSEDNAEHNAEQMSEADTPAK